MASPTFVQAAQRSTEVVHQQLQTVLSGRSSAVTIEGGSAVLDLAPFIEAAKQRLVASGFAVAARIPEIHPTVELFPASYARAGVDRLPGAGRCGHLAALVHVARAGSFPRRTRAGGRPPAQGASHMIDRLRRGGVRRRLQDGPVGP